MIARVLTTFTTAIALTTAAFAQQAAPAPVGTSGISVTPPAATPPSPPAAAPATAARVVEPVRVDPRDYKIGPEDVLDIHAWKNEELSRERVPVRPDGKISHPLVGDITVEGLTANQVKAQVTQQLAKFIDPPPEVSVVVREIHSPKVSVSGNVRMPGYFELKTSNVTVLDMLARAQGLNEFADKGSIRVIRRGQNGAIEFKYNDAINGKNGANFVVQPGDVIVVN